MKADFNWNEIPVKTVKKAYSEKQLKLVRKFNRIFPFYKDRNDKQAAVFRKVNKRFHQVALHTAAFLGYLSPEDLLPQQPLVPKESIERVKTEY